MSAERGVNAFGGELSAVGPVVGPRAPVADHLFVVAFHCVVASVHYPVSLAVGLRPDCRHEQQGQQRNHHRGTVVVVATPIRYDPELSPPEQTRTASSSLSVAQCRKHF